MTAAARVRLRPATLADAALLQHWRNDQAAVRFSRTGRAVTDEEHIDWLRGRLSEPRPMLWIAVDDTTPLGQVRIDVDPGADAGCGEVAITVDPVRRGRGLATAMLRALQAVAAELGISVLDAWIHVDNVASFRAFARCGFRIVEPGEPFLRMRWSTSHPGDPGA